MKKMKTELIKTIAQLIKNGSSCVGCMSWETPYVVFKLENNDQILWQSDNIDRILFQQDKLTVERLLAEQSYIDIECRINPITKHVKRIINIKYR